MKIIIQKKVALNFKEYKNINNDYKRCSAEPNEGKILLCHNNTSKIMISVIVYVYLRVFSMA